ncbi:hypothetical protein DPMN_086181 [Dreissena polymorpha]|uniref:Uncharacterized protein n=1 Tax=Dreissena polymorpha TaxID=45954 RepID=A0A9D3YF17_DREPO|nr:hypothetical protein DPMN_086181 [Dreissena polymorpha]
MLQTQFVSATKGLTRKPTMKGFIGILAVVNLFHHADAAVTGWTGAVTATAVTADGTYATAISESAAIGTSLFTVTATSDLTTAFTWTYTLTTGTTEGQIATATTGVVTSKAALNFETAATVKFVITASDGSATVGTRDSNIESGR